MLLPHANCTILGFQWRDAAMSKGATARAAPQDLGLHMLDDVIRAGLLDRFGLRFLRHNILIQCLCLFLDSLHQCLTLVLADSFERDFPVRAFHRFHIVEPPQLVVLATWLRPACCFQGPLWHTFPFFQGAGEDFRAQRFEFDGFLVNVFCGLGKRELGGIPAIPVSHGQKSAICLHQVRAKGHCRGCDIQRHVHLDEGHILSAGKRL